MKHKILALFFLLILITLLAACSQGKGAQEGEQQEESHAEHTDENETIASETLENEKPGTEKEKEKEAVRFEHVHGLAYELSEPYDLHLGTHYGVYHIDDDNYWTWLGTNKHRHDVMGFNFIDENTMISSGHPNKASNLKNPIGVIISTDKGETWEPIALHGEVDFHTFEVNASESGVLYGIDHSGFFRLTDAGFNWEKLQPKGLPENLQDIYSLVSNPSEPMNVLAGTKYGVFRSNDGGETWSLTTNEETIISAKGIYGKPNTIVAFVQGKSVNGLVKSKDFGATWSTLNLQLDDNDAVAHIAINSANNEEIAVGTFKGNIYRTTDNGTNWTMLAKESTSLK